MQRWAEVTFGNWNDSYSNGKAKKNQGKWISNQKTSHDEEDTSMTMVALLHMDVNFILWRGKRNDKEKNLKISAYSKLRGRDLTGTEMTATSLHRIPMPTAIVIFSYVLGRKTSRDPSEELHCAVWGRCVTRCVLLRLTVWFVNRSCAKF